MSLSFTKHLMRHLVPWRFMPSSGGWTGIDIGTSAIKVVQLEHDGSRLYLRGRWVFCPDDGDGSGPPGNIEDLLLQLSKHRQILRRMFRRREAAAVLPMSLMDYRTLEIPRSSRTEMHHMVREELAAERANSPSPFVFDFWELGDANSKSADAVRLGAVGLDENVSDQTTETLRANGFCCKVLDCVPCAMARAVQLADPKRVQEPALVLDLGSSACTLVLAVNGRPMFTRVLRSCGLRTFIQAIQSGMQVTAAESYQLLRQFGLYAAKGQSLAIPASGVTCHLLAHPLAQLLGELERTLQHLSHLNGANTPRRIWLLGGGAVIRHLDRAISGALNLPALCWGLNKSEADPGDAGEAIFGVAAALSALAWETGS